MRQCPSSPAAVIRPALLAGWSTTATFASAPMFAQRHSAGSSHGPQEYEHQQHGHHDPNAQQSVLHGFATRTPLRGHEANLNFATLTVFETFDYAKGAYALVCRWPFGAGPVNLPPRTRWHAFTSNWRELTSHWSQIARPRSAKGRGLFC